MYVGTNVYRSFFSDATVGVSKGIAVFLWTFGFYSYLQFLKKIMFLHKLLRQNNDELRRRLPVL